MLFDNTRQTVPLILFKVFYVLFVAASLFASMRAYACSCNFHDEQGFIHGSGHLPSNARGALFLTKNTKNVIKNEGLITIIDKLPKSIDPASFTIKQVGSHGVIPAVIEKVRMVPEDSEQKKQRVFYTKDHGLQNCIQTNDAGTCRAARVNIKKASWIQGLIATGRLIEVSKEAQADGALFRVAPVGGFVQGAQYTIVHELGSIHLTIDKPLIANATDRFSINLLDQPKRQFISIAASGSCSVSIAVAAQTLRYQLPAQYEAYRASFVYFTEQKYSDDGKLSNQSAAIEFLTWQYRSDICSEIPFGASELAKGEELVFTACDGDSKPLAAKFFRGRLGFLEMGDQLYQTDEVTVDFNKATTGSCIYESPFLKAVKNKDAKGIAEHSCQFDASNDTIDPQQMYPALRAFQTLMNSDEYLLRACAIHSTVKMYQRINLTKPKPENTLSLREKFKHWINIALLRPTLSDTEIVLQGIHLRLSDEVDHVKHSAKEALQSIVELLWSANSVIELPAKEKDRLLRSTLHIIGEMLAKPADGENTYYHALNAIATLGPRASSLLPKVLALANKPDTCYLGLENALSSIAPKDPRVFNALVSLLKTGRCTDAANKLILIGQDKKPAVVEALKAALKVDDYGANDIIERLGSMGKDARSAVPLLYQAARTSKLASVRENALFAIVNIDEDDANIVKEIALAIERPYREPGEQGHRLERDSLIRLLGDLGKNAQTALPTLKKVMTTKLTQNEKYRLQDTFKKLEFPKALERSLLAALENTTLQH